MRFLKRAVIYWYFRKPGITEAYFNKSLSNPARILERGVYPELTAAGRKALFIAKSPMVQRRAGVFFFKDLPNTTAFPLNLPQN
jgi:hypothetical protein